MNSFGRLFRISIFGESHGNGVGVVIDGCPAGLPLTAEDFFADLERRKGGTQKGATPRKEDDAPILHTGIFNGRTTGAPLTILFENNNTRSSDYEKQRDIPRPGHADFTARQKFGGYEDYRGSGHFSGRLTVALVAAGVVAKKLLELTPNHSPRERGADTPGYITSTAIEWKNTIRYAKEQRHEPTAAEAILWEAVRNRKLNGYKFRRQHPIAGYIPDFVCLDKKLIVEVDGGYHSDPVQKQADADREQVLTDNGYKVIRFQNNEVISSLPEVLQRIADAVIQNDVERKALPPGEGLGGVEAGISITATILEIAGEPGIEKGLQKAIDAKDSVGGIIECRATGIPAGLGEPFFDSVESAISHIVFAIPAIRGIEFGTGFAAARMFGSAHNDAITDMDGQTVTNHAGGVVGGITNGNELVFRVAVKPTSSTPKEQTSLNWTTGEAETFSIKGRHDLCIALRAPVVLEAVTAIVLADFMLLEQRIPRIFQ